ncbi:MAG: transporter substrate-binding domain-containing protein [Tissierellia bacterium]|nr:transporter substrate-binding domain-containing protein [Tissierellia bacterium]
MTKKLSGYISLIMIIVLFSLTLVGCGNAKNDQGASGDSSEEVKSSLDKIKDSNKIVLGTSADYPPYEFHKQIDGKDEIVGFDIEVAKEIAKDLGVELEIKDMDFDGLLAALDTGNVDFVVAGMTATDDRKKSVDFSKEYYTEDQGLLIPTADKDKYQSIDDLKDLKVGAQKGTVQEEVAEEKIEGAQVKTLAKITDLVLELKNGKINGLVLAIPVAEAYAAANPDLTLSPHIDLGKGDGIAIAVKKGNQELVDIMNATIDRLMEDDTLDKFIQDATALSEE